MPARLELDQASRRRAHTVRWLRLRAGKPGYIGASVALVRAWHRREAEDAEQVGEWPAVPRHLDRLIEAVQRGRSDGAPDAGLLLALVHARLGQAEKARRGSVVVR